ncbi:MAG TPA: riboflavin synthase [Actinomycetota bacterium]|jgi:riboflavin synthase|nr:riboflavin synthase [Actinomycetota bacterium]
MFTGIVEELGRVASLDGSRLRVACSTVREDAGPGASVAVNGVCLTVVQDDGTSLAFDLSEETLRRSALGRLALGDAVNLERAATLSTRFGGHLVQGHVDGVGRVVTMRGDAEGGAWLTMYVPEELRRYLVEKGSMTVDGVSLTVAALDADTFSVALIPHTLAVTTFGSVRAGDPVNLEVDVIAKYVERLLEGARR